MGGVETGDQTGAEIDQIGVELDAGDPARSRVRTGAMPPGRVEVNLARNGSCAGAGDNGRLV